MPRGTPLSNVVESLSQVRISSSHAPLPFEPHPHPSHPVSDPFSHPLASERPSSLQWVSPVYPPAPKTKSHFEGNSDFHQTSCINVIDSQGLPRLVDMSLTASLRASPGFQLVRISMYDEFTLGLAPARHNEFTLGLAPARS